MLDKERATTVTVILSIILFLLLVFAFATMGHAATTSKSQNSLGSVPYDVNPLVYIAGSVKDAAKVDGNLNLRFAPLGTYALFDQNILLCGIPVNKFEGVTEPFMLVYERRSHKSVQGVGCHEVYGVYSLMPKAGLQ